MQDLSDNEKLISLYPEFDPDPDVIYPYTPGLDNSSVRCICSVPFDDGATIQCDGCWVWQHMVCMEIDRSDIPKVYYCEECKVRPVNVQKAIQNQSQMQRQRRVERAQAITEILIKKGIIDKPSPRKKKESRGKKVLPSPRKQVKPTTIKQPNILKKEHSQILDVHSPRESTVRSGLGSLPDFPFRQIICLDDWTDGFLGKAPEKIKKASIENPYDSEYADWAINCANVQSHRFLGAMESKVIDFIHAHEGNAIFWDGAQLKLDELEGKQIDLISNSKLMDLNSNIQDLEDDSVTVKIEEGMEICKSIDSEPDHGLNAGNCKESRIKENISCQKVDSNTTNILITDIASNENLSKGVEAIMAQVGGDEQNTHTPETMNEKGVNGTKEYNNLNDNVESTTQSAGNVGQEKSGIFDPPVLSTTRTILRTSPVRYCVDLIPVKEDNEIPHYGLFSTCDIPSNTFICTTFGTLSEIGNLDPSLLPYELQNNIYILPPFTLKVLKNQNWILDCRTSGDMSGRYCRRSCSAMPSNSSLYCMIVKDESIISEKIVFGIFSTKDISRGEEIILSTPDCNAFPCSCENGSHCQSKKHFKSLRDKTKPEARMGALDRKETKVPRKMCRNSMAKKTLPVFLKVLVLSHQKRIKSLKAEKLKESVEILAQSSKLPFVDMLNEPPAIAKAAPVHVPRTKPPASPVIESPKAMSREERKLKEQLALFEKMEQQDKKKKVKRRTNGDTGLDTASPSSKKGSEDSEDENYTGSSSKTPETYSRDSPASFIDTIEKTLDETDQKRKSESIVSSDSLIFKKPKLDASQDVEKTPAPLVRKLSLKDFLQKRNQNKTPSPSSSGHFFPSEAPEV